MCIISTVHSYCTLKRMLLNVPVQSLVHVDITKVFAHETRLHCIMVRQEHMGMLLNLYSFISNFRRKLNYELIIVNHINWCVCKIQREALIEVLTHGNLLGICLANRTLNRSSFFVRKTKCWTLFSFHSVRFVHCIFPFIHLYIIQFERLPYSCKYFMQTKG